MIKVRLPVRVLDSRSNGWRDLTVTVQGGGRIEPVEIELAFDGESYPTNPSVPPARPLQGAASGEILIDDCRRNLVDGEVLVRGT